MTVEFEKQPDESPELQAPGAEPGFQHVHPGYRYVLRVRLFVFWVPLMIAAAILDLALLEDGMLRWLPTVGVPLLGALVITIVPQRKFLRLQYRLTERLLQVVRGWLFHSDTIVPFVRVQHIDVTRGPIEKAFGTSTLVVHTAGTHNSVVTLPGLDPERAAEIRDVIREHIRSDFG